ncbi:MAG: GNAT family N-acetyltransferase [Spirochaetales bacterium]|nr:GNAT family N-acetyltransferase [Spirochaetales bacterium]
MEGKLKYPVESKRILLCPYEKKFLDSYAELMRQPETHRYNYTKPKTRGEAEKRIRDLTEYDYANPKNFLELAIVNRESSGYMGYAGLKSENTAPWHSTEIYYTIAPRYFNQGFGTEAVLAVLNFGFTVLGYHRISAGATVRNTASWKIMENLGMKRECHWIKDRPCYGQWDPEKGFAETGEWEDGYGYAINEEEFFRLHGNSG